MNMTGLDWGIVALLVAGLAGVAFYTKRLTNSVSDFLAANRCAGSWCGAYVPRTLNWPPTDG